MSWEDELFAVLDDLEQQAEGAYAAERDLDVVDRSRAEYAQVTLAARLMASTDRPVELTVRGVGRLSGELVRVAAGWCLLEVAGNDWIVPLHGVAAVEGASDRAVPELAWPVTARLGLGSALRRLAEAGDRCLVHRDDGERHDGVLRRVGADFVEVAEGRNRLSLVVFDRIAAVQSRR